ncbi:N-acetylglucosamine kinase-like BadF-type ATPase [Allonocardiopsis opalescens]|uniref:N-acetylglucosamine kinase-like BadF-type ATPase n=1 Tax=Allonocardiopsis opalescens TaxID=1144618 RepID=A0A2T0QAP9_9ACTN|nr:N-acetylglucosamine kinase-like BadF-type ATPase [Allonocardiopsis opalescens]
MGSRQAAPRTVLAVDAGKSNVRAAVFVSAEPDGPEPEPATGALPVQAVQAARSVRGVTLAGGPPNLVAPGGVAEVWAVLEEAWRGLAADVTRVDAVAVGLTGVRGPSPQAAELARLLRAATGAAHAIVCCDVLTGYLGALGARPGAVVAAGTGAVALGVPDDGPYAFVDGWGYLLGDGASSYTLGRRGLTAALRDADGRGPATALAARLAEHYGGPEDAVRAVYGSANPPRDIAAFATDVLGAAEAGDEVAAALVHRTVTELAELAAAALRRERGAGPVPVSWHGSLFLADELVLRPFLAELAERVPDAVPVPPAGDGLDGARTLAAPPPAAAPLLDRLLDHRPDDPHGDR